MALQTDGNPKHLRSFWPLIIILIIAALVGGLVYWFQFQLVADYDLQSMEFKVHKRVPAPKAGATLNKTTTTKPVQ